MTESTSSETETRSYSIAAVVSSSLALEVSLLLLKVTEKKHLLLGRCCNVAPEPMSYIFGRGLFWCLNLLFRHGFSMLLGTNELAEVDNRFATDRLCKRSQITANAVFSALSIDKVFPVSLGRL